MPPKRKYFWKSAIRLIKNKSLINVQAMVSQVLKETVLSNSKQLTYSELKEDFEIDLKDFKIFWYSISVEKLRENGLLLL